MRKKERVLGSARRMAAGAIVAGCILAVGVAGVASVASVADVAGVVGGTDGTAGTAGVVGAVAQAAAEEGDAAQPKVIEKEDGTLVQRTPLDGYATSTTIDGSYMYHMPEGDFNYNVTYLDADNKGCTSCHYDLGELLAGMDYAHVDLRNDYGIQVTVQMCLDCHTYGWGYICNQKSFGSLIHNMHNQVGVGTMCWSCHDATGSGDGMQLWDDVKYEELRGILGVADVQGEFGYTQDYTNEDLSSMFDFGWDYYDLDYMRTYNADNSVPLDQEMFDTWTITISGDVEHEITYTLPELIEKFGSEDAAVTFQCTLNPTGGPLISNGVYTGVPLSRLFEEAGLKDDAAAFVSYASDGFAEPVLLEDFTEAYLAYEVAGEPLSWQLGYPVTLMVPGMAAPASVKEVCDIVVVNAEDAEGLHEWNGWPNEVVDGGDPYTATGWPNVDTYGYVNKPNVGIFDFDEGTVVETGSPVTLTGYAAAFDERIVGIEFSMDNGATWTRYDTPDTTNANWVVWSFTYTPEVDYAYVLKVRAVSESGLVTEDPVTTMFNAMTTTSGESGESESAQADGSAQAE